jgi:hypothetical protein
LRDDGGLHPIEGCGVLKQSFDQMQTSDDHLR